MSMTHVPARLIPESRTLTAAQFQGLSDAPPDLEWFANIPNAKTRKAYQLDIADFSAFVGINRPKEFRLITRVHVIAWRKDVERRRLSPSTIRRKPSALSSLFEYLRERNAVTHNLVKGVKRPKANNNEGMTPALSEAQELLKAPPAGTPKGVRDGGIPATPLFRGIRREELCKLRVRDHQRREGIMHSRIEGKGDEARFIPVATEAQRLIKVREWLGHAVVSTTRIYGRRRVRPEESPTCMVET
jgi:integrase/recombinase XerD